VQGASCERARLHFDCGRRRLPPAFCFYGMWLMPARVGN
jgi:hypothetical protein